MPHPYWPLFDLRIRTPRLELRPPDDGELIALARVAAAGVHDADLMPFAIPWTEQPTPELERRLLQWHWGNRGGLGPERWRLSFAVFENGQAVGAQDMRAEDFARLRTVNTGSWLGREHHGRGIGKEMRAAVLHLAFAGLDALVARTAAFADNAASLGVTRALGYVPDGEELAVRRGVASRQLRFRMERAEWERHRRDDIVLEGLEPCRPMLVADDA